MVRRLSSFARIAAAIIALIALASCSRGAGSQSDAPGTKLETVTFTADRDIALDLTEDRREDATRTRTALDKDCSIIWDASDMILVFTDNGGQSRFACEKVLNDGHSAVFTGKIALSDAYYALLPYQQSATCSNGEIHAVLPAHQDAVAGSFDPQAALAVALSDAGVLHFKNVGALVNFVIRDEGVRTVRLSGSPASSGVSLAGGATVTYNGGEPVAEVTEACDEVVLSGEFVKDQRYYMVVYPGTYENLQLVFEDASGRTATFSNPVALTLERNSNVNLFDQQIPEGKWILPSISLATTIEVEADGVSAEGSPVIFTAADGWGMSVTYDGCVDYAYFDSDIDEIIYTVAKNTTSQQRVGSITVTLSRDGFESIAATATVIQEAGAPVTPPLDNNWYLVKSTADLVPGDEYVFACNSEGFVATDFASGAVVLGNVSVSFSDKSKISQLPANALIVTLGGSAGAWTFSNDRDLKLGVTEVKKLAWGKGTTTWKIAISGDGTATVQSTTDSYGKLQYNANAPRFTTYTSTGQKDIQLYHRSGNAVTTVTTSYGAAEVTSSSAKVSGSFHCVSAAPSEAGILYGMDASYLYEKAAVAVSGATSLNFDVTLSNLYASTTYYFKAYAVENGVTYYGSLQNFTTNAAGGVVPSGNMADYGWPELPAQTDKDRNGIDDNNSDYYYSHTFRADAASIRNFSCCYSKSKIHPVWVAAPMHYCYLGGSGRNDSYKADPNIKCTQNGKFDGYTRGHMVGSSDRTVSVATNKQAFYYSNIGAQLSAGFNTGGGVWNNLEDRVDDYLCADTLYQVIGCIFDPFTDHYGSYQGKRTASGSDIPTAYYKALLRTKSGNTRKDVRSCTADELQCVAFIVIHNSNNKGRKPSSKDMYSIAELEALTGLTFFVNVPNAPKNSYKASDWGL